MLKYVDIVLFWAKTQNLVSNKKYALLIALPDRGLVNIVTNLV